MWIPVVLALLALEVVALLFFMGLTWASHRGDMLDKGMRLERREAKRLRRSQRHDLHHPHGSLIAH